jgi:hypothetical protein
MRLFPAGNRTEHTMSAVETYTEQLIYELRLRDVSGYVIGDAVAQVESHIADTDEDLVAAFGTPADFAATFRGPRHRMRFWLRVVVCWLIGFALGSLVLRGVFALIHGEGNAWGLDPIIAVVVGSLGIVAFFVTITGLWMDQVKNSRKKP